MSVENKIIRKEIHFTGAVQEILEIYFQLIIK